MSEREEKARVFPKGLDWFWLLWGLGMLALNVWAGNLWLGMLLLMLSLCIMMLRRNMRIWEAKMKDESDKLVEIMDKHLIKGDEDGRNSDGREESSPEELEKRP